MGLSIEICMQMYLRASTVQYAPELIIYVVAGRSLWSFLLEPAAPHTRTLVLLHHALHALQCQLKGLPALGVVS